jgi:hypothetical protein
MSDFSVSNRGIPGYGIADVVFPLQEAEAAYDAVTRLLSAMSASVRPRNTAADTALANWTGTHGDDFRKARNTWLDGRLVYAELQALQGRLLRALKRYQELQGQVVADRQHAHADAARRVPRGD